MLNKLNSTVKKNISNIPGWRTKKRFVVIESDDWGSIRMPSREVFKVLSNEGIDMESDEGARFNKFDTLATSKDLELLFEVLSAVQDSKGSPAVLTPLALVANPDFRKIADSEFEKYYYLPFTETLQQYPGCEKSYKLWKEGIDTGIFQPQFHGREHLNVKVWMKALREKHHNTLIAFANGMWGISTARDQNIKVEFQAAYDFIDISDLTYQGEVIQTGLDLFEKLFGYRATFFVPPNGPFSLDLEPTCVNSGIEYLSASKIQIEPIGMGRTRKRIHWLGQRSDSGIRYLTRNCFFEPSDKGKDWIDSCLQDISTAFYWKKPAVISSHRVNFIGALNEKNREDGLRSLQDLLARIIKSWPDVEFITSAELGDIIRNE